MLRTGTGRRLAALVLLALGVASCDHVASDATGLAGGYDPQLATAQTVEGSDGRIYTLVEEPNLASEEKRVTGTIGLLGGSLEVVGHKLTVPPGAVSAPTLFAMTRLPNGRIMVNLLAVQSDLLGNVFNAGALGFDKPVTVELTYSRATNVTRPQDLVILRMNPKGTGYPHEVMPSVVDESRRTVRAQLDHFSGYCMAM